MQVARWQAPAAGSTQAASTGDAMRNSTTAASRECTGGGSSTSPSRPQLNLVIDDTSHEPAALAVIANMYGGNDVMQQLPQPLLVCAAVLADRLQAAGATSAAVDLLQAAATSQQGLSAATMTALGSLKSWPACLLPVLPAAVKGSRWYKSQAAGSAGSSTDAVAGSCQQVQQVLRLHWEIWSRCSVTRS